MKLTKQIKEDWLKALKSGEYVQGRTLFENKETNKFCCLGVLCKVIGKPTTLEKFGGISNWKDVVIILGKQGLHLELAIKNDANCDGKFTAVIPMIEQLKTVD